MCYVPSKLLYLFTGNLDVILLNKQTEDKNWTKNCIKLALVHMYTTRLENLPNHTRDRQKFVRQRQFWTSTSGPSWQHQCREGLGAENCGGFSHHSDSSSRTAESVQKKIGILLSLWHFWSIFSKVHLLTKWTRFAKSLCSDIDLDFQSLFSGKGPTFGYQSDL